MVFCIECFSAAAENRGGAHQREGPEPAGGQDELCQGLAVAPRVRCLPLCGEVPPREEGRADRGGRQQDHEDDARAWGPPQDMEVQHHEGIAQI